jgi:hypothetical protein
MKYRARMIRKLDGKSRHHIPYGPPCQVIVMLDRQNSNSEPVADTNKAFELISINLIYDYPVHWSRFKTLRDFIQNFYDAVHWSEWDDRFSYTLTDRVLTLKAQDVGFSYDWLLHIGASTKREEIGNYAGHFGEGFKIAALCAVRDHHWTVKMCSRDWELEVVTTNLTVDQRSLKSLAYKIKQEQPTRRETILQIAPFNDQTLLDSVLLSFYYPSNPLLGQPIWTSTTGAVYTRSSVQKPWGYPSTSENNGSGIVFAGYQAVGSFEYPLVFCLHDHRQLDRERNTFYRMNVIDLIRNTVSRLSPEASMVVLQLLKSRWYDRPRKKYDFTSWYGIVGALVRNIAASAEQKALWQKTYPHLLVASQVKRSDLPQYNRRRQALDWLRQSQLPLRLVQEAFLALGYPTLEAMCEQCDGFSVTRDPDAFEQQRVAMLEQFTCLLVPDLIAVVPLPPCKLIKSEAAAWRGMTSCIPLSGQPSKFRGIPIRYRLPYVALKSSLLYSSNLGNALSTYLHEIAHMFGGDRSAAFSHALSELMEVILSNAYLVAEWSNQWEQAEADRRISISH